MFKISKHNVIDFTKLYKHNNSWWNKIFRKKTEKNVLLKYFKYFSFSLFILVIICFIYIGVNFLKIKNLYYNTVSGKLQLELAAASIKEQDFKLAIFCSDKAINNFDLALDDIKSLQSNLIISHIPAITIQFRNINYVLSAGKILSRAVKEGSSFVQELGILQADGKNLTYSKYTPEERSVILKKIYESGPELAGMKANLDLALLNLENINYIGPSWLLRDKLLVVKDKVMNASNVMDKLIPMSQLIPKISGYPNEANYLFILQNKDELRPTGGFIGTYGIVSLLEGEIERFDTHDVYHMDMPVKDSLTVEPPVEIKKYLGVPKWYMRDANWSPDWPTSAQKIQWFYDQENKLLTGKNKINNFDGQFNGVIGVTTDFITSLLHLVGPVTVEGVEYNEKNFSNLLEYRVEKNYVQLGVSKWQRKEVIGEIGRILKIKLLDFPSNRWNEIYDLMIENFQKKSILIYMNDTSLQNMVREQDWSGELKSVPSDYVMVVDSNMASLKTDAIIDRSVNYLVEATSNGLMAKLNISYSHQGGVDWRTTKYNSYTRVYVPSGAKLIKSVGNTKDEVTTGRELNKTYFGAFVSIGPGQIGNLYFEYLLPQNITDQLLDGKYSLYMQKQPGKNIDNLVVNLKFIDNIKSYSPTGFYTNKINNNEINWQSDLNKDRKLEVNF